jgi:hypothetical protein
MTTENQAATDGATTDQATEDRRREYPGRESRQGFLNRRRERIVAEIQRNRRGEYTVPTWVLVLLLLAIVAGWAALIIFS